jgi:hypothetical protein
MPKFTTKKKYLTAYALNCGYVEHNEGFRKSSPYDIWLEHNGGTGYDVSVYEHRRGMRRMWETYETLKEAKKAFHDTLRQYKCLRHIPSRRTT